MKKIIGILFFTAIIMILCAHVFAADINGDGIQDNSDQGLDLDNDGINDSYRSKKAMASSAKDILIAHETAPLVYFGWYRMSQLTIPGWDLFQRVIDWVDGGSEPANTRVILFTYSGSLNPGDSAEQDGIAVYNYLMRNGYDVVEVHRQSNIEALPSSYYNYFDLAIYAWIYPRDATNIVSSGIPFITVSSGETDEMGIGTGENTMHEYTTEFNVVDDSHYITQPYPVGALTFPAPIWTDASEASGSGIVLINARQNFPVLDIKVNGQDDTILVTPDENVTITVSLDPNDIEGELVDWWIGLMSPYGTYWQFRDTIPLSVVPETVTLDRALPPGLYTCFFILDDVPDGIFGLTWYDYVNVICESGGATMKILPDINLLSKDKIEELVE